MKIYTAQLIDDIITAPTLNSAYIGHPEVLERVTKQICTEYNFYFTGMALIYGFDNFYVQNILAVLGIVVFLCYLCYRYNPQCLIAPF